MNNEYCKNNILRVSLSEHRRARSTVKHVFLFDILSSADQLYIRQVNHSSANRCTQ